MPLKEPSSTARGDYGFHALVFLSAICARILFLIFIDEPILFFKYPFFAEKIAGGADIGERLVDLSPLYLYALTVFKTVFGMDWHFIKCFQVVLGALNAVLVFAVGNRIFQKGAALAAALLFAFYGNLIVLETTLEPTVFVLFFDLLAVYWLILSRTPSKSQMVDIWVILAAGIFTGLGIITKPNFLLFLPLGLAWILFFRAKGFGFKRNLAHALLFLCAVFLFIAPVTVRNYLKLHDFVLVTADAGKVFFHGNSKTATAIVGADLSENAPYLSRGSEPDYAHVVFRKTASKIAGKTLSPSQAARFWVDLTLKDIRDDPLRYVNREFRKVVHFFTDYEVHYIASAHKEYKDTLAYPFLRYAIIVSLGFLGILLSMKQFKGFFLLYGVIGVYLLSCTIFLVNARYRTPAVPYFCLFAGYAVYKIKDMIAHRRIEQLGLCALFLGIIYFGSLTAFKEDLLKHDRWQEATKICYEMDAMPAFKKGAYENAITALTKSISILPTFYPAYVLRGRSYAMLGKYEEAEADFKKAISLNPQDPRGHRNIGFLYLILGKRDAAEDALKNALEHDPQNKKIKEALARLSQKKAEQGIIKP